MCICGVCACTSMCGATCGDWKLMSGIFLSCSSPHGSRQSLNLELTGLVQLDDQGSQGFFSISPAIGLQERILLPCPTFKGDAGAPKSGGSVHTANNLSTVPTPRHAR